MPVRTVGIVLPGRRGGEGAADRGVTALVSSELRFRRIDLIFCRLPSADALSVKVNMS